MLDTVCQTLPGDLTQASQRYPLPAQDDVRNLRCGKVILAVRPDRDGHPANVVTDLARWVIMFEAPSRTHRSMIPLVHLIESKDIVFSSMA